MDPTTSWRQSNVAFDDWAVAEHVALSLLVPALNQAHQDGFLAAWFFVRKAPCYRIRYLPHSDDDYEEMRTRLQDLAHREHVAGRIARVTDAVYEPEVHAFGGDEAMEISHRLFHHDSRHLAAYLTEVSLRSSADHRREMAVLLCTALLRGARLDWYEQGDVWAQVARHRDIVDRPSAARLRALISDVRRLMSVDTTALMRPGGSLAFAAPWAEAYSATGADLADLAAAGRLHRGLRAVLAHHLIFTFNRFGLPHAVQALLADAAKSVVFGADPTTTRRLNQGETPWTTQTPQ